MRVRRHSPQRLILFLAVCLLLQLAAPAQVKPVRRVLILNEVGTSYPLINLVDDGIRLTLANAPYQIEFYREYMDTTLFPDPGAQQLIRNFYLQKYGNHKPDVIVTVGSSPLKFMAESHRTSFAGVPVVFCFPSTPAENILPDPDFTGVGSDLAPRETIAAALRLMPETKHLVVVGGSAPYDRRQQAFVKEQLRKFEGRLDILYFTDLSTPSLLDRLRHLPPHTVVLLTAYGRDSAGTTYNANESGPMIVSASNAPVFSLVDRYFGHGEVGGDISSAIQDGEAVGNIVLRLLNGEKAGGIPVAKSGAAYVFDWKAMRRWGMKERNLPHGSIVMNRKLSLWATHRPFIIGIFLLILAQTIAICGLLWYRTKKRQAESQRRRSEEKFSKSFRQSPLVNTMTRISDDRYIDVNDTFEVETGWARSEIIGRTSADFGLWLDPDQNLAFRNLLLRDGSIREFECTYRRKNGEAWTALVSASVIDIGSEPCILSVIADVSQRKAAEDLLSTMSQKLIEAHEEERVRIARELHDDIGQRIVIVGVGLETLKRDLPVSYSKAKERIQELCESISDLVSDVQAISHRLHSSKLEYFGLEVASAGFCRELSEQRAANIIFRADKVPKTLPSEVSLCLFRVLQEALQNAVKHSGVHDFEVSLTGDTNEVRLIVRDLGRGFDFTGATHGFGLGLTSMRERMKLVDGYLSIDSTPGHGTTVLASVSLQPTKDDVRGVA